MKPPVAPVKPTSTFDGNDTAALSTVTPSIATVIDPLCTDTCTWRTAARNDGTLDVLAK